MSRRTTCDPAGPYRQVARLGPAEMQKGYVPKWHIPFSTCDFLVALTLLGDLALQKCADFRFTVPAVSAERTNSAQLARLCPARNRLRVDAEHRRHLGRGQQGLCSCVRDAIGHSSTYA